MPIKDKPSRNIPFLKSYVPYSTNGEVLVEDINDMFSYSIAETSNPVSIQYTFGATRELVQEFSFTNLTTNAELEFEIESSVLFKVTPSTFILSPGQTTNVELKLKTGDLTVDITNQDVKMNVSVKNLSNGSLVYKDLQIVSDEPVGMGDEILVYF